MSPRRMSGEKDWENGSTISSPASIPEYTGKQYIANTNHRDVFHVSKLKLIFSVCFVGPKLYKEPSFKSNKFIIHNAITRCCLAGKVNEPQKNKIVEVSAVSPTSVYTNFSVSCSWLAYVFFSPLRKWRKVLPTTSSSCSGMPVASLEQFTPWTLKLTRWFAWLGLALVSSCLRWSSPFTSTVLIVNSSLSSRPKPCPWVLMPLPSLGTFGKSAPGLLKSWAPQNKRCLRKVLQFMEPAPKLTPIIFTSEALKIVCYSNSGPHLPGVHMDLDNNPLSSTCEGPIIHLISVSVLKWFLSWELLIGCAWSTKIVKKKKKKCNATHSARMKKSPYLASRLLKPYLRLPQESFFLWLFGKTNHGQLYCLCPHNYCIFRGRVVPAPYLWFFFFNFICCLSLFFQGCRSLLLRLSRSSPHR